MAVHRCNHAGCREYIELTDRYCAKHRKAKQLEISRSHQDNDEYYSLYQSTRWRKTSRLYRSAHPVCESCSRKRIDWLENPKGNKPILNLATSVDHIKALKDGGDPFDWANLQALCSACHNEKTKYENLVRNQN